MARISRQLSTAYQAGLPVIAALQIVVDRGAPSRARRALIMMADSIRDGSSLADAAREQQAVLPELFIEVLAAGETGGRLDVLLADLADHYDGMEAIARATKVAMVYPALQLASAWYLGSFALGIIRTFTLTGSGTFSLSSYLSSYGAFQFNCHLIAFTVLAILFGLNRLGSLNIVFSTIKHHLWPVNRIIHKFALARFFQGFSILLGAGIEIKKCIRQSAAMTLHPLVERDLLQALPAVAQGKTLIEAFAPCKSLTRVDHEMIGVGEVSGELEASCKKLSEYHLNEAASAVQTAMKILQVVITLVVGAIIGYIVISFYGRLYGSMLDL
ncbi:MAG: hypothetical protein GX130_03710 [Candidatus Hydrogenedens sp.]|nr:hypothetical protein [Candidatus Hydrogenedens sp.]